MTEVFSFFSDNRGPDNRGSTVMASYYGSSVYRYMCCLQLSVLQSSVLIMYAFSQSYFSGCCVIFIVLEVLPQLLSLTPSYSGDRFIIDISYDVSYILQCLIVARQQK